jgi:hypothetical protein
VDNVVSELPREPSDGSLRWSLRTWRARRASAMASKKRPNARHATPLLFIAIASSIMMCENVIVPKHLHLGYSSRRMGRGMPLLQMPVWLRSAATSWFNAPRWHSCSSNVVHGHGRENELSVTRRPVGAVACPNLFWHSSRAAFEIYNTTGILQRSTVQTTHPGPKLSKHKGFQ